MAKIRYESEGIYVGRDLYTWDDVLKEFRKLVLVDPKAKVTNINELQVALERAVFDTDMKRNRWGIWSGLKEALDYLSTNFVSVYIILDGARQHDLTFVEVENEGGFSVSVIPPLAPYPERGSLWRLGPVFASVRELGTQAVSGVLAPGSESARKDGASDDSESLTSANPAPETPYKGPIAIPCSACSAGDTAMEYHTHNWVPLEDRRPAYPEKTTFHGGQDR